MRRLMISLCAAMVLAGMAARAAAQDAKPPLITNQAYVEDLARKSSLAVGDPMAVFAYVLDSLPERVKVYPTENHYYFAFDLNGVRYAGNIKLVPQLRAEGKVAFAYYEDRATWLPDAPGTDLVVGSAQGVTVEKIEPLAYRITYKTKSVVFALNDLSNVKPPAAVLGPDDRFIGPIFDESGVRFFLVFNAKLKLFHFILDETIKPADVFVPAPVGERPYPHRQAHGICGLPGSTSRSKNHDRRLPRQCGGEQLSGRPVRPDARQFYRGRYHSARPFLRSRPI